MNKRKLDGAVDESLVEQHKLFIKAMQLYILCKIRSPIHTSRTGLMAGRLVS